MCHDADSARRSREEVDANVLCLAAAGLEPKTAIEIAQAFIGTQFQAGDPQSRQVAKIGQLETGLLGADKAPLKPGEEKAGRSKSTPPRPTSAKPAAPPREAAGARGAGGPGGAGAGRARHGARGHDPGAGAAGPAQAARGGGDAALPRGSTSSWTASG